MLRKVGRLTSDQTAFRASDVAFRATGETRTATATRAASELRRGAWRFGSYRVIRQVRRLALPPQGGCTGEWLRCPGNQPNQGTG